MSVKLINNIPVLTQGFTTKNDWKYRLDTILPANMDIFATDKKPPIDAFSSVTSANNICIVGDSISTGAFVTDINKDCWSNQIVNTYAAQYNTGNLGLVNTNTGAITDFNNGIYHKITASTANGLVSDLSPNNIVTYIQGAESITYSMPRSYSKFRLLLVGGAADVGISVDGGTASVFPVTTNANILWSDEYTIPDGKDNATITITRDGGAGTFVYIAGIQYYNDATLPVVDIYSKSGLQINQLADNSIDFYLENYKTIIWAMGYNDGTVNDQVDKQKLDRLVDGLQSDQQLLLLDFGWTYTSSYIRNWYKDYSTNYTNIHSLILPEMFYSDSSIPISTYLIDDLEWWDDAAHPNIKGHNWITKNVCNKINLQYNTTIPELYRIDCSNNRVVDALPQRIPFYRGQFATAPSNYVTNDTYFDTSTSAAILKYYNGTEWANI